MSAEIIDFMLRPNHDRDQIEFPTITFRSAVPPNDLAMDYVDTSRCENVSRRCEEQSDEAIR